MLVVAGHIDFDPATTDRAREACAAMMAATHEEPGNLAYVFSFDASNPGRMQIFECWESQEDLDAHFTLPHMADFQSVVPELGITGMKIDKYHVSSVEPMRS
jgi:quinol monooxygenase YgiN